MWSISGLILQIVCCLCDVCLLVEHQGFWAGHCIVKPAPSWSCRGKLRRCAASRHMLHLPIMPSMPLNFLPQDGSLGERWDTVDNEKIGGVFLWSLNWNPNLWKETHLNGVQESLAWIPCGISQPMNPVWICFITIVFITTLVRPLRVLCMGTKAEAPTMPDYVSTKSIPAPAFSSSWTLWTTLLQFFLNCTKIPHISYHFWIHNVFAFFELFPILHWSAMSDIFGPC